jgi:hypothetical protein
MPRTDLFRWAAFLAVLVHGIGMVGGVYFVWATRGWLANALPTRALTLARVVVAILWAVSGVLLIGAAWAFFRDLAWWRPWALLGAPLSLAGILLWAGRDLPPGTYVGAALDVAVVAFVLFAG